MSQALESERASVVVNLSRIDARLGRPTDAFVDGTIEKDLYENRKTKLLIERARFRDHLASLKADEALPIAKAEEKLQLAETAILQYELGSVDEKRRIIDRTTCNRLGSGRNVDISLLPPFDRLAETLDSAKCAHYRDEVATAAAILDVLLPLPILATKFKSAA